MRDAEFRHHGVFVNGGWIFDPADHVLGRVWENARDIEAVADSGVRAGTWTSLGQRDAAAVVARGILETSDRA